MIGKILTVIKSLFCYNKYNNNSKVKKIINKNRPIKYKPTNYIINFDINIFDPIYCNSIIFLIIFTKTCLVL